MKINESYAEFGVKPKIEVTHNAFKITLPNVNYGKSGNGNHEQDKKKPAQVSTDTRENTVIDLLEEMDTIARKDVETALKPYMKNTRRI